MGDVVVSCTNQRNSRFYESFECRPQFVVAIADFQPKVVEADTAASGNGRRQWAPPQSAEARDGSARQKTQQLAFPVRKVRSAATRAPFGRTPRIA